MRRSAMFISLSQSDTDIGGKEHRPEPVSRLDWVDGTRLDAHGCHSQATERSRPTVQIVQVLNHEGCRDTSACMLVGTIMLLLQRVAAYVACGSEERLGGDECVGTFSFQGSPQH